MSFEAKIHHVFMFVFSKAAIRKSYKLSNLKTHICFLIILGFRNMNITRVKIKALAGLAL